MVAHHSKAMGSANTLVLAPDSTIWQNPSSMLSYMWKSDYDFSLTVFPLQELTWRKDDPCTERLTKHLAHNRHLSRNFLFSLFTKESSLQVCIFNKYKFNPKNFGLLFFISVSFLCDMKNIVKLYFASLLNINYIFLYTIKMFYRAMY